MSEAENAITAISEFKHVKQKAFNRAVVEILIENGLVESADRFNDRAEKILAEIQDDEIKSIGELLALRR
ncbi:hypothetical protein KP77_24910 [Jeotgalibacillus alimentarius]|uniref:Uncharacterized protein n=1 Tax=Jeotgalibacillus alimentarius TaxID=135826 RepID=A0A0C2VSG4_9BACL|nr:hypothetical protein [Jeotgalibacillus alimentarius]KIL46923.1 hypothetical protein KP77_24910 [Jeotgalibacillus alimentarius]